MFQHDNERLHVAGIVQIFLDTENVRLVPWLASFPDLSLTENVWSMVAEQLACYHTPATTVNELWHLVESSWIAVLLNDIQSLYDSKPRHITADNAARRYCSRY